MSPELLELCSATHSSQGFAQASQICWSQRGALGAHHFVPVEHQADINLWVGVRHNFHIYGKMQKTGTQLPSPCQESVVTTRLWLLCGCFSPLPPDQKFYSNKEWNQTSKASIFLSPAFPGTAHNLAGARHRCNRGFRVFRILSLTLIYFYPNSVTHYFTVIKDVMLPQWAQFGDQLMPAL